MMHRSMAPAIWEKEKGLEVARSHSFLRVLSRSMASICICVARITHTWNSWWLWPCRRWGGSPTCTDKQRRAHESPYRVWASGFQETWSSRRGLCWGWCSVQPWPRSSRGRWCTPACLGTCMQNRQWLSPGWRGWRRHSPGSSKCAGHSWT